MFACIFQYNYEFNSHNWIHISILNDKTFKCQPKIYKMFLSFLEPTLIYPFKSWIYETHCSIFLGLFIVGMCKWSPLSWVLKQIGDVLGTKVKKIMVCACMHKCTSLVFWWIWFACDWTCTSNFTHFGLKHKYVISL